MDDEFESNEFPLAYLITVRTYGTWLHGDDKLSVDRHGFNVYGSPRRAANAKLKSTMQKNMRGRAFVLNDRQRATVKQAVNEVCDNRGYYLWAMNVLTNHLHTVVSAQSKPEPIANAFKSYSTRKLRESKLIPQDAKPWSRGRSRRYLWKPKQVTRAIDYVLFGQGDIPDFDD